MVMLMVEMTGKITFCFCQKEIKMCFPFLYLKNITSVLIDHCFYCYPQKANINVTSKILININVPISRNVSSFICFSQNVIFIITYQVALSNKVYYHCYHCFNQIKDHQKERRRGLIAKINIYQTKKFFHSKVGIKFTIKMKKKVNRKTFTNDKSDKELISKICKEIIQINIKKQSN